MIYIPGHFAESDAARLQALVNANSFGTLISSGDEGFQVSHLPFLFDAHRHLLQGHMARANPQWQALARDSEVVVIFHGPHHYVSPAWYGHHPSVPTWNYAVVHVQGRPRLVREPDRLESMLRELVDRNESTAPYPWRMDLPPDYQAKMVAGIIGFEIEIVRMDAKFKLSQNRLPDDQVRVAEALEGIGSDDARGVARLMRENLDRD
jgi:transcriptional regulator